MAEKLSMFFQFSRIYSIQNNSMRCLVSGDKNNTNFVNQDLTFEKILMQIISIGPKQGGVCFSLKTTVIDFSLSN